MISWAIYRLRTMFDVKHVFSKWEKKKTHQICMLNWKRKACAYCMSCILNAIICNTYSQKKMSQWNLNIFYLGLPNFVLCEMSTFFFPLKHSHCCRWNQKNVESEGKEKEENEHWRTMQSGKKALFEGWGTWEPSCYMRNLLRLHYIHITQHQ